MNVDKFGSGVHTLLIWLSDVLRMVPCIVVEYVEHLLQPLAEQLGLT